MLVACTMFEWQRHSFVGTALQCEQCRQLPEHWIHAPAQATSRDAQCVFCKIIAGESPAEILQEWHDAIAIRPLNPVTGGHTLILPKTHVPNAVANPAISAITVARAAEYALASGPCNIITSIGADATQTVFHLHLHIIPRRPDDGLKLPWSDQERSHD